jgi:hypothetical protein
VRAGLPVDPFIVVLHTRSLVVREVQRAGGGGRFTSAVHEVPDAPAVELSTCQRYARMQEGPR